MRPRRRSSSGERGGGGSGTEEGALGPGTVEPVDRAGTVQGAVPTPGVVGAAGGEDPTLRAHAVPHDVELVASQGPFALLYRTGDDPLKLEPIALVAGADKSVPEYSTP